jgi:hypothetical protein
LFGFGSSPIENDSNKIKVDTVFDINSMDFKRVPSVDTLFMVAKKYLGKHAYLFTAVKIVESGNTNKYSWLAINHFNLCGMRFPTKRKTYAISKTNTNYAIYRNWFECMLDFKIYIHLVEDKYKLKHHKTPTDKDMIEFLSNSYNQHGSWKTFMFQMLDSVKNKYL